MSIITKVLKQRCVYWAPSGPDKYGQPSFVSAYQELACRWDEGNEEKVKNDGGTMVSTAQVMVSEDVQVHGVLLLVVEDPITKQILNVPFPNDPFSNPGAFEIQSFEKTPNFNATEFLREAFL